MTVEDALDEFAAAGEALPRAAMRWALDNWAQAAPRFLALLDAYASGAEASERDERALFLVLHLLAERGEAAAFAPLCRLLHDPGRAELALGDALGETLAGLLISTFDGDAARLEALVELEAADEVVRYEALQALAYLARAGRVPEPALRDYLRHLLTAMRPHSVHYVWFGWVMAVGALGYADLAGEVEALFRRGLVSPAMMDMSHFRADLRRSRADPKGLAGFTEQGVGPFTDAIGALGGPPPPAGAMAPAAEAPVRNPLRDVGRNDPCPCGSGRKFKKCCLV